MKVKIFGGYLDTMETAYNKFRESSSIHVFKVEVSDGKIFVFYKEITTDESVSKVR